MGQVTDQTRRVFDLPPGDSPRVSDSAMMLMDQQVIDFTKGQVKTQTAKTDAHQDMLLMSNELVGEEEPEKPLSRPVLNPSYNNFAALSGILDRRNTPPYYNLEVTGADAATIDMGYTSSAWGTSARQPDSFIEADDTPIDSGIYDYDGDDSEEMTAPDFRSGTVYVDLKFLLPVSRMGLRVSSPFGWRIHPVTRKRKHHQGVDFAVPVGSRILASADGVVEKAGDGGGYGQLVIIRHSGGYKSCYAHGSRILVGVGDEVRAGQLIMKSGNSGLSTGPHLHFEIRKNGIPQNPIQYVTAQISG